MTELFSTSKKTRSDWQTIKNTLHTFTNIGVINLTMVYVMEKQIF